MFKIPTVLTSDELLDKAFKQASKVEVRGRTRLETVRESNIAKVNAASDILVTVLGKYVKAFPSVDRLDPFYLGLVDVVIGKDRLKKSLGAMDWCRGSVARVARASRKEIAAARTIDRIDVARRSAYGRMSSFVKQIGKELEFLSRARDLMRRLPSIDPELPTVVVAGAPNVGKSQLVKIISTAKPRVDTYPFTTQEISIGIFQKRYWRYQVIDTPGLLDRPLAERNAIELRAVLALKHLADVIVFMLDPSETCGYTLKEQEHLLSSLREEFSTVPVIVVENKADLQKRDSPNMKISASSGEGVEVLVEEVLRLLPAHQQRL